MDLEIQQNHIELIPETEQDKAYLKDTLKLKEEEDEAVLVKEVQTITVFGVKEKIEVFKIKPKGE